MANSEVTAIMGASQCILFNLVPTKLDDGLLAKTWKLYNKIS